MKSTTTADKKLLRSSYIAVQKMAKTKKSHTIAEILIMPCTIEITKEVFEEEKVKVLTKIPTSNDTVKRWIVSMPEDIVSQCFDQLRDNDFAIQLDESTDISKMSHLLAYVWDMWNKEIKEDFLSCKELKTTTKSDDIFKR
ncbi:unnamed protein product [Eretmochelys imbricata]